MNEWKPRRSPRYSRIEGPQNRSPAVMSQRLEPLDSYDVTIKDARVIDVRFDPGFLKALGIE